MRGAVAILFLITSHLAFGQNELLNSLWSTSSVPDSKERAQQIISSTLDLAAKKKNANDLQFLNKLFNITHKKVFNQYVQYSGMEGILDGNYDCLTATAWFSAMLTETGYRFEVIETNYHIFLIVHTSQKDVLIETTDRFNGFVTEKSEIERRLGTYRQNLVASSAHDKKNYSYQFDLYRQVEPEKLAGLLYFNQAVKAYNNKDLKLCAEKLSAARGIYETPRVAELAAILLQSVVFSNSLTALEKGEIEKQFGKYRGELGLPLASR